MIGRDGLNRESIITRYINTVLFVKTSSIDIDENMRAKGIGFTDLVKTSPRSWIMEGRMQNNPLFMNPPDGKQMKSYRVAVLASGRFDSFFRGKDTPQVKDDKQKKSGLASSSRLDSTVESGKSQIIVVGCSDITRSGTMSQARRLLSGSGMSEAFSNDIFLHSMVDYLAGRYYVPEMKSKSLDYNPLDKTEDSTRFMLKIINMGLVPVSVVVAGLVMWRRRSIRRKLIETEFSGGEKI